MVATFKSLENNKQHYSNINMNFSKYQEEARRFAIYKDKVTYPALGLASEAGEVCGKVKKVLRDTEGISTLINKYDRIAEIKAELGDVLWYIANLASDLEIPLEDIAEENISKLQDRMNRNQIKGSGDNR
jgi:NTP pyrophosphatase (non-canonical NTP hydrolase)